MNCLISTKACVAKTCFYLHFIISVACIQNSFGLSLPHLDAKENIWKNAPQNMHHRWENMQRICNVSNFRRPSRIKSVPSPFDMAFETLSCPLKHKGSFETLHSFETLRGCSGSKLALLSFTSKNIIWKVNFIIFFAFYSVETERKNCMGPRADRDI